MIHGLHVRRPTPAHPAAAMRAICCTLMAAALAGCAASRPAEPAKPTGVEAVASMLEGSFSSEAQSLADPEYFAISLHMARIWTGRDDGPWLYVEQAMAARADRPYRQRVYRVRAGEGDSVVSEVYTLPGDPLRFAGAWARPEAFDALSPADLQLKDGCDVVLRPGPDGFFVGGTVGTGCASDLRGASYATSEVRLDATGMTSWDRGYNAGGEQVWGAEKGGYRFDRLPPPAGSPRPAASGQ